MSAAARLPETDALIHPVYARMLRRLLMQAAVDPAPVLAAAGLVGETLDHEDRPLSLATTQRLALAAMAATGRPWLGLDLGGQTQVSMHGLIGFAAVTAPDLGEVLQVFARYSTVRNEALVWSLEGAVSGGAVLRGRECADWGAARGFYLDTVMAATLRLVEAALGELPEGLVVDWPLPAPAWQAQYQRFAPVGLRFGAAALAVHADARALRQPCLGADPRAHASACRACEAELRTLAERNLSHRVAGLLRSQPAGRYPSLAEVAHHCGLGHRTLMRRLAAEGSSFQALLDEARQARALWLLRHTRLPVEEVAAQLGLADTSNFSRIVRRWFNCTPSELRRAAGLYWPPQSPTAQNRERQHGL